MDKYAETLLRCLEYISNASPTQDELKRWFLETFPQLKGGASVDQYIYSVTEQLSVAEEDQDGRLRPSKEGKQYLTSRDPDVMYGVLDSKIAGISDIVEILRNGPLTLSELHLKLRTLLNKDWESSNQTFFRVNWLISLGKVERVGHNYVLKSKVPERPLVETVKERIATKDLSLADLTMLIANTEKDTSNHEGLEEAIAKSFHFLGYDAKHIGGSGQTDVLLTANLGSVSYRVVIDAKTSTSGIVPEHRIDWDTLEEHRKKHDAKYISVVGPGFEGTRVQERARNKSVTLIPTGVLIDIMKLHEATPFDLFQLEDLFKQKGIPTDWKDILYPYVTETDISWSLVSSVLLLLYSENSKGRELSIPQLDAVLNSNNVECNEEQVSSIMTFLSSPPISAVKEDQNNGKFILRAAPATIARKLGMLRSRIAAEIERTDPLS